MNASELLSIIQANPWNTVGSIVKLAEPSMRGVKEPDAFVKAMIKELRSSSKLKTVGKVRGTRYAHIDALAYVEPELSRDLVDRVLAQVNSGKSKSAEIEKATGADIAAVREALRDLLEAGQIDATGNKKSRRYWPKGKAPAVVTAKVSTVDETISVKREAPPRVGSEAWREGATRGLANSPVVTDPEPAKPVVDTSELLPRERPTPNIPILEAAHIVLAEMPRRSVLANRVERNVFTTGQLAQRLVDRWGFARYHAGMAIIQAIRENKTVIHHQHRYNDGWGVYVWRPTDDAELPPPERQDLKSAGMITTISEPDDAPTPKKRGRPRKVKNAKGA